MYFCRMAYYLDVRHAFRMFVKKMKGEFKTIFQDATDIHEEQRYVLDQLAAEEKAKSMDVEMEEGSQGIVNFQVRIVKEEKSIFLLCFSHHDWEQPITNAKDQRKWAIIRIPLITLKTEEDLPEKYILRKIQFSLSSSSVTKYTDDWYKYTGKGWQLVADIEAVATANIKERKEVKLGKGGENNQGNMNNRGYVNVEQNRGYNKEDHRYENEERNRDHNKEVHRERPTSIHIKHRGSEDREHNEEVVRKRESSLRERERIYERGYDMRHVGNNNTIRRPVPRPLPAVPIDLMSLDQPQTQRKGYDNNMQPMESCLTDREIQILEKAANLNFDCDVVRRVPEPIEKRYNLQPPETAYHHLKREGFYESRGNRSEINRPLNERPSDNFRPDLAKEPGPSRSTGNWETELHRARLQDVLPPMVSNFQRNRHYYTELEPNVAAYEDIKYTTRGEQQKPNIWKKVTDFDKSDVRSDEQWDTIKSVRSTIGGAANLYEEPNVTKEVKKEMLDWVYKPLDRFLSDDARAKTPVDRAAENVWTSEMAKNMDALSLTGTRPKTQESMLMQLKREKANQLKREEEQRRNDLLTQEQERKRVIIEIQMAQINKLNQNINSQVYNNNNQQVLARESPEDEDDLLTYRNILCSTNPALVGNTYQNRLEIMSEVQDELEQTVRRKSRRLQKLQAAPTDLRVLSRRERGNLE